MKIHTLAKQQWPCLLSCLQCNILLFLVLLLGLGATGWLTIANIIYTHTPAALWCSLLLENKISRVLSLLFQKIIGFLLGAQQQDPSLMSSHPPSNKLPALSLHKRFFLVNFTTSHCFVLVVWCTWRLFNTSFSLLFQLPKLLLSWLLTGWTLNSLQREVLWN